MCAGDKYRYPFQEFLGFDLGACFKNSGFMFGECSVSGLIGWRFIGFCSCVCV